MYRWGSCNDRYLFRRDFIGDTKKKSVTFSECIVSRYALDSNELKNDGA
jgi:hypothetical protein